MVCNFNFLQKKVVSLQDMAQNASAQILTLQQECVKRKDQEILQNLIHTLSTRVDKLYSPKVNQERPQQIEQMYTSKNSTNTLIASLANTGETEQNTLNKQSSEQKKLESLEVTTESSYKTSGK